MLSLTDCGCDHEYSAGDEESFDCVCREDISLNMMEKNVVSGNKTTQPNLKLI